MEPDDIGVNLVGLTEIAQRAGVQKPVVSVWHSRHETFPEPISHLRTGAVWWWPHVKDWLEETNRRWDADYSVAQVNRTRVDKPPPGGRGRYSGD